MRLFDTTLLRKRISLNGQWFLAFDPENKGVEKGWARKMPKDTIVTQVPWSWNCHLSKHYYTSICWYYKKFYVNSLSSIRFVFGAVSGYVIVFLDGEKIGEHYGSFTDFVISAQKVPEGWHTLAIRVDAAINEIDTLPLDKTDWFNYGGIFRSVYMELIDKISVEHIKVTYDWVNGKARNIAVEFRVKNWSNRKIDVSAGVYFDQNKVNTVNLSLLPRQLLCAKAEVKGLNPRKWSLKDPYLYTVRVVCGNDDLIERVGFRNISTGGRDILLNDEPIFLKGINRHNIHPDFGFAVPPQIILQDVEIIKSIGCNCIRGSHYPNDPIVLDYCDQMGLLFWEELPLWGLPKSRLSNKRLQRRALYMLEEMIVRDINHPSIICWGIQNESASDSEEGKKLFSDMACLTKKLDRSRLLASASNKPFKDISSGLVDLIAINNYHGWYDGRLEDWEPFLDKLKIWLKKIGQNKKPLVISEFGAEAVSGEKRLEENVKWTEQYQKKYLGTMIKRFLNDPEIGGMFIWQYCDIPTSPHLYISRPREYNNKGIVNEYRLPKESFWIVRELLKGNIL